MWSDNSPAKYRAWTSYEPDGCCGPNVKCAQINGRRQLGRWSDVSCERKNLVVCKYDAEGICYKTEDLAKKTWLTKAANMNKNYRSHKKKLFADIFY